MTAKNGNISLILKFVLAAAVVAGGVVITWQRLGDIAVVAPVTRGKAVSAVSGSVLVSAGQGGVRELKAEAPGRVANADALSEDRAFQKGDVLLQLDTKELERDIELSKSSFESLQELRKLTLKSNIEREVAKENLDNAQRFFERGEYSAEAVKNVRRALDATNSKFEIEEFNNHRAITDFKNALESKQILLQKMTIIAQEDGVVATVLVTRGALINAGQAVATIISKERVVTAQISEENFGSIRLGQKAKVRLLIYGNQPPFDAVVSKFLPIANEATQRYTVFLDVAVDPVRLVPGSNGQVNITVEERDDRPLIPRRALFNGTNVFVVNEGRVQLREVSLGLVSLSTAEITKGLAPGELVIVENLDTFRNGQRVRIPVAK